MRVTLVAVLALAAMGMCEFLFTEDFPMYTARGFSPSSNFESQGRLSSHVWRTESAALTTAFGQTYSSGFMRATHTPQADISTDGFYSFEYSSGEHSNGVVPGTTFMNPGTW